ncbi:MAG: hypothetical protein AAGM67_02465 [Bacteroidota bacterium]
MTRNLFFLALLATLGLIACGGEKQSEEDSLIAQTDTIVEPSLDPMVQCLEVADQICGAGVWFAILGEQINNLPIDDLQAREVADSALADGGYVYIKRTIYLDQGEVVVEGTFLEEANATDQDLNTSKVHRIFFRNPNFHTPEGLEVGNTVLQLRDTYAGEELAVSVIPDYETVVVQLPGVGNMFAHFTDPGNAWSTQVGESLSIDMLPPSWQVREIVVM